MPVSDYIQNGNSQMFLQSVFSAHYLDIFYIYMPLTSTVTLFLNLDFLYISSAFLPIHFLHYRQNIHLSKRYVLSRIVFVNIEDIFSIYGMLYSPSSCLQSYYRHCWFCLYHVVNVIFICFHISYYHTVSLTYLIRKPFYII